jgi:hypothetical protein
MSTGPQPKSSGRPPVIATRRLSRVVFVTVTVLNVVVPTALVPKLTRCGLTLSRDVAAAAEAGIAKGGDDDHQHGTAHRKASPVPWV